MRKIRSRNKRKKTNKNVNKLHHKINDDVSLHSLVFVSDHAFRILFSNLEFLISFYAIFRYPHFGEEIAAGNVKFDDDETFIDFGTTFTINHNPFKEAPLWDSLFPLSKK